MSTKQMKNTAIAWETRAKKLKKKKKIHLADL